MAQWGLWFLFQRWAFGDPQMDGVQDQECAHPIRCESAFERVGRGLVERRPLDGRGEHGEKVRRRGHESDLLWQCPTPFERRLVEERASLEVIPARRIGRHFHPLRERRG